MDTLGQILTEDQGRDAVHIAIAQVTATEELHAGDHIGFAPGSDELVRIVLDPKESPIGIVDPFLKVAVKHGERCWMFLYPNTITTLRHEWTHPAFEQMPTKLSLLPNVMVETEKALAVAEAKSWLQDKAAKWDGPSYDQFMELMKNGQTALDEYDGKYVIHEGYGDGPVIYGQGLDAHGEIDPEVYEKVAIVLGEEPKVKPKYFTCSC